MRDDGSFGLWTVAFLRLWGAGGDTAGETDRGHEEERKEAQGEEKEGEEKEREEGKSFRREGPSAPPPLQGLVLPLLIIVLHSPSDAFGFVLLSQAQTGPSNSLLPFPLYSESQPHHLPPGPLSLPLLWPQPPALLLPAIAICCSLFLSPSHPVHSLPQITQHLLQPAASNPHLWHSRPFAVWSPPACQLFPPRTMLSRFQESSHLLRGHQKGSPTLFSFTPAPLYFSSEFSRQLIPSALLISSRPLGP